MKFLNYHAYSFLLFMFLISVLLVSGCAKATLNVLSPAEINTSKIKTVVEKLLKTMLQLLIMLIVKYYRAALKKELHIATSQGSISPL